MRDRERFDAARARERNYIGRCIAEARVEAGMNLAALGRAMARHGVSITDKGLSKWETGATVPNGYQLMAVCRALGMGEIFSDYVPALNDAGMKKLADYREDLIASGRYRAETPGAQIEYIEMPVCYMAASAGTGLFLDGDDYELMCVPRSAVPAGAAFGVRVSGDSMEPVYQDGQIVWVQPCDSLRVGEVGIFGCGGEGYIKAYGEREPDRPELFTDSRGVVHPQPVLISFNEKYAPRPVPPEMEFRIFGRVLH